MSEYLVKYLHKIDCNNYSAGAEKLKIPPGLQALLAQLLAKDERYAELSHFVNSKVFVVAIFYCILLRFHFLSFILHFPIVLLILFHYLLFRF